MVDCSTDSTSQKLFKLCSRRLSSRSRNVCWGSCCVVVSGVRPESVQQRTVSLELGNCQGVSFCLIEAFVEKSAPMSWSMLPGWSNCSSVNLMSLVNFLVLMSNLLDGVVPVMWDRMARLSVVCQSVCLDLKCTETLWYVSVLTLVMPCICACVWVLGNLKSFYTSLCYEVWLRSTV